MIEDANPKPAVLRFSDGCDAAIFAANGLGRAVQEADIAVLGPGGHHAFNASSASSSQCGVSMTCLARIGERISESSQYTLFQPT